MCSLAKRDAISDVRFSAADVTDDAEVLDEDGGLVLRRSRKFATRLPCREEDAFSISSQLFLLTRSVTLFTAREAAAAADDDDGDDGDCGGGGGDGLTGDGVLLCSPPAVRWAVTSALGRRSALSWHEVDDVMTMVGTECDITSACCSREPTLAVSLPPVVLVLLVVLVTIVLAVAVVDVA